MSTTEEKIEVLAAEVHAAQLASAPPRAERRRKRRTSSGDQTAIDRLADDMDEEVDDIRHDLSSLETKVAMLAGEVNGTNALLKQLIKGNDANNALRERNMRLLVLTLASVIIVAFCVVGGLAGVAVQVKALGQEVSVAGHGERAEAPQTPASVLPQ